MKVNKGSKKVLKEYDDYEDSDAPIDYSKEWPVGTELMIKAPSDGEQPYVVKIEGRNKFPTKLGTYESYIAKVEVKEVITNKNYEEETDERLAEMRSIKMKLTKSLLRKLVKEAIEDEMGSEEQTDTKSSSRSDLVKKLKDKVLTIGSPSGWGEWITDKDDEWFYDDGEGGYDTELEFDYKDPANIVVRSGENEKTIPLNNEKDIEEIIKQAEQISGLTEMPEDDSDESKPSEESEETDERLAEMRKIRQGFRKLLK